MFVYNRVNDNGSNNLLLVLLVLMCCTTSSLFIQSISAAGATTTCSSSGSCYSSNSSLIIVQNYWEQIDNEILELTCQQNRLIDALTVLKVNSTLNNDIITIRSKQLDKLNKSITPLNQESSYLKSSFMLFKNGTTPWMYKNGKRAKSCSDYRYPTLPFLYTNEGNGLYNIEPIDGIQLTVQCQMNMYMDGYSTESIVIDMRLPNNTAAKTCKQYKRFNTTYSNGVYYIKPFSDEPEFKVYCDMTNGGYTVFQRRINGRIDFLRGWQEYSNGFGDEQTSYWLGLKRISKFTQLYQTSLRIDMYHKTNNQYINATYSTFSVGTEAASNYTLTIGGYSGSAGDSLTFHNGFKFTTIDRDNDIWSGNCAQGFKGAWWYRGCHQSNLNGLYLNGQHTSFGDGIEWISHSGQYYSLEKTQMGMIESS